VHDDTFLDPAVAARIRPVCDNDGYPLESAA
jgi:hypothetical protein